MNEIDSTDQWKCTNSGCNRAFKRTSSSSIKQHQQTCIYSVHHMTQYRLYGGQPVPMRTNGSSNSTYQLQHINNASMQQQQYSKLNSYINTSRATQPSSTHIPLLAHTVPHPVAAQQIYALYNQPFTYSLAYHDALRSTQIPDQLAYLPTNNIANSSNRVANSMNKNDYSIFNQLNYS